MKRILTAMLLCLAFIGMSSTVSAQKKNQNIESIEIKVSGQCGMCKERIEKEMAYTKGVKTFKMDLRTKTLALTYDKRKTTPEKIKTAISKLGHDADDVKANEKAYDKLPNCCKATHKHGEGCSHHH